MIAPLTLNRARHIRITLSTRTSRFDHLLSFLSSAARTHASTMPLYTRSTQRSATRKHPSSPKANLIRASKSPQSPSINARAEAGIAHYSAGSEGLRTSSIIWFIVTHVRPRPYRYPLKMHDATCTGNACPQCLSSRVLKQLRMASHTVQAARSNSPLIPHNTQNNTTFDCYCSALLCAALPFLLSAI